ncbi:hypothetical protein F442_18928 [Phytophthora nicotianae P10297]|uniref:Uncharacterized protein n=1 Tax=Phytophthora nicotianae P10297 TaxID=1317064 RepID=W2YCK4_PHYNI|nr:hypothetical protein F442_18928 [Phytophthora nicotianae P10297]
MTPRHATHSVEDGSLSATSKMDFRQSRSPHLVCRVRHVSIQAKMGSCLRQSEYKPIDLAQDFVIVVIAVQILLQIAADNPLHLTQR